MPQNFWCVVRIRATRGFLRTPFQLEAEEVVLLTQPAPEKTKDVLDFTTKKPGDHDGAAPAAASPSRTSILFTGIKPAPTQLIIWENSEGRLVTDVGACAQKMKASPKLMIVVLPKRYYTSVKHLRFSSELIQMGITTQCLNRASAVATTPAKPRYYARFAASEDQRQAWRNTPSLDPRPVQRLRLD